MIDANNGEDGPWRIVQKPRRNRKIQEVRKLAAPMRINDGTKSGGSQLHALTTDDSELMGNDSTINADKGCDIIEEYNNFGLKLNKVGVSGIKNFAGFDGIPKSNTFFENKKNIHKSGVSIP